MSVVVAFLAARSRWQQTSFLGGMAVEPLAAQSGDGRGPHGRLGFLEVPPSTDDAIVVPAGCAWDVLAPWGTPLLPGAPDFAEDASNTAAEQALQVGFNHDGIHYFPLPRFGNSRGLLVVNHEYTDANQIYTAVQGSTITPDAQGREKVAKALAAHGVSVIAIRKNTDGSEARNDDTLFEWDVFLLAGDPAYDANVPAGQTEFGSPDGVWVDPRGIVWIQTDISNSSQNLASRGYDRIANNAMLAASPEAGEVRRFLTGPRGCEITGVIMTPDQRTMFINVQHPGESTTFWNGMFGAPSTANPTAVSRWPFGGRPRSATVVIRKLDGGRIGS